MPTAVKQQIEDVIGLDASEAVGVSAKTGLNVEQVLEAIVKKLPAPTGKRDAPLKALLIDSWYDAYLGVVVLVRVIDGALKKGQRIKLMSTDANYARRARRHLPPEAADAATNSAPAKSVSSPPP